MRDDERRYHNDHTEVPTPDELDELIASRTDRFLAVLDEWVRRMFFIGAALLVWVLLMLLVVAVTKGDIG